MKNLKIKIFGEVQGVGFRFEAQQLASDLDLNGFARNDPADSVYIEVEGDEYNLNKFLNWCRVGPKAARIDKFDFEFSNEIKGYGEFLVK